MIGSLRALPDRVPLRVTLVSSVLLLVTVALGVSGATGTYMLRGYLVEKVDLQLQQAAGMMTGIYERYGDNGGDEYLDSYLNEPVGWASLTVAFVNVDGAGRSWIFSEDRERSAPRVDRRDIGWVRAHADQPFTARPVSGRGHSWRVMVTPMPDGNASAIVAISLDEVDDTAGKLAVAHLIIGAVVLAVLAVVGYGLVRANLRRLVQAERTAREIAAGDLTRRVPAGHPDTEVGRLAAAFNSMLGEIEQAFRAREHSETEARASEARMRRFAADASHELRTPLTAIRGFAELYRQGGGDAGHVIGRIEHHATRMSALVEDLLLLARVDQRRPVEQAPVDILALAADAVHDTTATAAGHPVRLVAAADRPPVVIGDELQLRQVIGNLLTNAVQHTPAGTPVTVSVGVEPNVVGASDVVLTVADTGPGLTADDATRVFERFYRTDPSRARSQTGGGSSGSGLGLSIVYALVTAHGGTIRLATAPGAGARFEVRLPLFAADGEPPGGEPPDGELPDDGPAQDDPRISTQPEAIWQNAPSPVTGSAGRKRHDQDRDGGRQP